MGRGVHDLCGPRGLASPLFPPFELINHFRPFALVGCLAAAPLMLWLGRSVDAKLLMAFSLSNLAFCALPFLTQARQAAGEGGEVLKIVAFNMEYSNRNDDRVVAYLKEVKPDFVLFEEVLPQQAATLFERLKLDFPSQLHCPPKSGCILGLLTKARMTASGFQDRTKTVPPEVWAEFSRPNGPPLRVVGLHLARPSMAFRQSRHIETLIRDSAARRQPLVLAGDFNLTPWSWSLNKFG